MRKVIALIFFILIAGWFAYLQGRLALTAETDRWAMHAAERRLAGQQPPGPEPALSELCLPEARGLWARVTVKTDAACVAGFLDQAQHYDVATLQARARGQVAEVRTRLTFLRATQIDVLAGEARAFLDEYRQAATSGPVCSVVDCAGGRDPARLDNREVEIARRRLEVPLTRQIEAWSDQLDDVDREIASDDAQRRWSAVRKLGAWTNGLKLQPGDGWFRPARLVPDKAAAFTALRALDRSATKAQAAAGVTGRAGLVMSISGAVLLVLASLLGAPLWPVLIFITTVQFAALAHLSVGLHAMPLRFVALRQQEGVGYAFAAASLGTLIYWSSRHVGGLAEDWLSFSSNRQSLFRGILIAVAAGALLAVPMLPAVRAELLIALGALALATFAARNVAWYDAAGATIGFGWPIVAAGAAACGAVAILKGDLGAALLSAGLFASWVILCGSRFLMMGAAITGVAALLLWLVMLPPLAADPAPAVPEALRLVIDLLKPHARSRFEVAWTPFHAGPSDVARSIWMSVSGGYWGWGLDHFPAEGLDAGRAADRSILQAPEDYFASVLSAIYGVLGLGLVLVHAGLFAWAGIGAIVAVGSSDVAPTRRLLALWAAFGCISVTLRAVVSTGGSLSTLALTGVPIPALAHGQAAAAAAGLYLGVALACLSRRKSKS